MTTSSSHEAAISAIRPGSLTATFNQRDVSERGEEETVHAAGRGELVERERRVIDRGERFAPPDETTFRPAGRQRRRGGTLPGAARRSSRSSRRSTSSVPFEGQRDEPDQQTGDEQDPEAAV